jgi:hypothetical protein
MFIQLGGLDLGSDENGVRKDKRPHARRAEAKQR